MAARIEEQKLDLTEPEFALLLQACARGGAPWDRVQALLKKMTRELTRLQPETLAAAEQYFRCMRCVMSSFHVLGFVVQRDMQPLNSNILPHTVHWPFANIGAQSESAF